MSTKSKKVAACGLCVKKETRARYEVTHMEKEKGTEGKLAELREQAESKVKQHIVKLREQPSMGSNQLIHELQVHQIELEMQNEELRQSQLELDESRTKYLDLFEFAPVGYFTLNEDGLILEANLTSTNLLAVEKRNLINRRLSHFITADTEDVFHLHYREVLRTKSKHTCELKLKRADGSEFHAEMVTIPCRDPGGNLTQLRTAVTDITNRRKAEDKLLEYRKKLKLMASKNLQAEENQKHRIAIKLHDIICQNLVVTKVLLQSTLKLASDPSVSGPLKMACKVIGELIDQSNTLVHELSNPILHELGIVVALQEFLDNQVWQKHGIAFEIEADEELSIPRGAIKNAMFRVSRELLMNVVKHARASKVKVSFHRSHNQICVRIQDDGVGFNAVQAGSDVSETNRFGLFSVREQLEHLGGNLAIESEPGRGTTAKVVIPIEEDAPVQTRRMCK